ncbi:hypothetical protein [Clostridium felsineum]|uniref:hypothetical protein n=1 Tax=Clostridium felsineum TaxID=36839 RepID=UPI00098C76C3|nr:hypothetical protein [Clostridium felsineum]URZ16110.1 hypothetical protein CLFE_021570 [Clostridium felsineum DSM 794]
MNCSTVYVFIGSALDNNIIRKSFKTDGICFVDKDSLTDVEADYQTKVNYINLNDSQSIEKIFEDIEGIKSIVVCPSINNELKYDELLLDVDRVLRKLVIFSKGIYPTAMRNKGIKVWFLDSNVANNENYVLTKSFSAGVNAISKTFGMELARKSTIVNYIKLNDIDNFEKISDFIDLVSDKSIYLDMQNLIV